MKPFLLAHGSKGPVAASARFPAADTQLAFMGGGQILAPPYPAGPR
jgi:hypothetical protein